MQIVELPLIPEWLNNGIFLASLIVMIVSAIMLGILQLHQRADTTNQGVLIAGYDVSNQVSWIVHYQYPILIGSAIVAFTAGPFIFPSTSDDPANHAPIAEDIERNMTTIPLDDAVISQQKPDSTVIVKTPEPADIDRSAKTKSTIPDIPPRTPQDLLALYRTQTWRDVMRYKGMWMRVEGTVRDIGEVIRRQADPTRTPVIQVTLTIGSRPHDALSNRIEMYVDADQWKPKLDQIRRGDWVEAQGIVDHVSSRYVGLIDGEILSFSRSDGNRR